MKLLITALILVACVPAAFASTPTTKISELADTLTSETANYDSAFYTGAVLGFTYDPKVCAGNFNVGSIKAQIAGEMRNYLEKHPSEDKGLSVADAAEVILDMMRLDYPCK